jgi:hypothetical protein
MRASWRNMKLDAAHGVRDIGKAGANLLPTALDTRNSAVGELVGGHSFRDHAACGNIERISAMAGGTLAATDIVPKPSDIRGSVRHNAGAAYR